MNNYQLQVTQAKKRFLTYNQQELITRCRLQFDEEYFYLHLLTQPYRIHRLTGDMERQQGGVWTDGNSFNEVMTVLDWLCDSRQDRYISGRWINVVTHGHYFHGNLQEDVAVPYAKLFDQNPEALHKACQALQGEKMPEGDIGYTIELLDGLRIYVQFWHGDEEFAPRLRFLWDENTNQYLRYETTWYANDDDGLGEIRFDFSTGTAQIVKLADGDLSRTNVFAKIAIRQILKLSMSELPKKLTIPFELEQEKIRYGS